MRRNVDYDVGEHLIERHDLEAVFGAEVMNRASRGGAGRRLVERLKDRDRVDPRDQLSRPACLREVVARRTLDCRPIRTLDAVLARAPRAKRRSNSSSVPPTNRLTSAPSHCT
jgi:hypothetical protein